MANITVASTNAGLSAITANLANVSLLDITKFEIGNGFNYTPTASQAALVGTKIYDETSGGGTINKILVGTKSVELQIILNSSVTLSNIGEFLFKTSAGVIVAIGAFDVRINKTSGNTLTLKILINITNNGAVTITSANTVFNSINVVETTSNLPLTSDPSSNMQIVRNYDGNGAVALAFKDAEDSIWKYFTQVQGATVLEDEIVLSKSNRSLKTSSKTISDDADFSTNSHNKVPTKYAVEQRIQAIVAAAPGALDTLNELAAALGNDANFATTMTNALAGKLAIASNLSDLNNKKTARANLGVETKTTFSNADITLTVNDRFVVQTGTMTAPRTATLPAASAFNAGQPLLIVDSSGTVNSVNKIAVTAAGADTIDNFTSVNLTAPRGVLELVSDGVSKWKAIVRGNPYSSELFSMRNLIMNGDFMISQRIGPWTSAATGTFSADRWCYVKSGAMVHDISLTSDVPTVGQGGRVLSQSLLIDCQTVDSSISSTDFCTLEQRIEGYNFLNIAQKPIVISFWVKATKTGVYGVFVRNSGNDRSFVSEITVNSSDVWEYKVVNIDASPSAGTWDYGSGIGLNFGICLSGGSSFQTTPNTWQTGAFLTTSNQVNACDNTANNFKIACVQMEEGYVPTRFDGRTYGTELFLCERYFTRATTGQGFIHTVNASTGKITSTAKMAVEMRTNPTATQKGIFNAQNGTGFNVTQSSPLIDSFLSSTRDWYAVFGNFNTSGQTNSIACIVIFVENNSNHLLLSADI